jgi:hypothetical protein
MGWSCILFYDLQTVPRAFSMITSSQHLVMGQTHLSKSKEYPLIAATLLATT